MSVTVGAASPRHASAIATLFRESFPERLRPYLVYAQPGGSRVIADSIAHPDAIRRHRFLVGEVDGRAVAAADFVVTGDRSSLSYIAVEPSLRGRGVARTLIEEFRSTADGLRLLDLEVFDDNLPAKSLYERLGFVPAGTRVWVRRPVSGQRGEVRIPSAVQVGAARSVLGFCEFDVHAGAVVSRVNIVGSGIRCADVGRFNDDRTLAAIAARLGGIDHAFAILDGGDEDLSVPAEVLIRTEKLELEL